MRLRILITLTVLLAALSPSTMAQQRTAEEQRKIIAAIEAQIAQGERDIASIRNSKSQTQTKISSLARQVEQRQRLLSEHQSQLKLLQGEISVAVVRSEELGVALESEREAYGQMAREAYRNYQHNNFLSYIFASRDFNDMARRIVNIRRVAQLRQERMTTIDSLSKQLDSQRVVLIERTEAINSTMNKITTQKANIERDIKSARADIQQMSTKERSALQAKALQQEQLSVAIEQLRELSKGNREGSSFSTKTSNLNLPVSGGRVKRYMDNMAEVVGGENAAVVAIYEGKVVDVKQNRITGKYDVYIAHGEYITSYAGLKSVSVAKNGSVNRNQRIGVVGAAVDIITMNSEYKIIFGIYPPSPNQKMKAADCFKK